MSETPFSEHDVEQIIARAIEIDVHGRAMSLARLREVARDLDISPEALNQALAERGGVSGASATSVPAASPTPTPSPEARPWNQWFTAASVAAGTLTGALAGSAVFGTEVGIELSTTGTCAAAAALLWLHRTSRNGWELSAQLLALWSSYTYAFAVAQGGVAPQSSAEEVALVGVSGALVSIIAGNIVLFVARRWTARAERRARKATQHNEKKAGVRTLLARLTGSFHTPNPSP